MHGTGNYTASFMILWWLISQHSVLPQVQSVMGLGEFGWCSSGCCWWGKWDNRFWEGRTTYTQRDINSSKTQSSFYLMFACGSRDSCLHCFLGIFPLNNINLFLSLSISLPPFLSPHTYTHTHPASAFWSPY